MTRLGPLVVAVGPAVFVGAVFSGTPLLGLMSLVPVGVGVGGIRRGRGTLVDQQWSAVDREARGRNVARRDGPSGRSVVRALRRVEARELALDPWFGLGVGLCAFMAIGFGLAANADGTWEDELQGLTFLAHPLVGLAVVAAHRAATRARRDGADELFDACPTLRSTRVRSALGSAWVPPVVLAAFFAAYIVATALSNDLRTPTGPVALHIASGLSLGVGGVVLGVALGRWVRFGLAPLVAIVIVGFVSLRLADGDDRAVEPGMLLSTLPPMGANEPALLSTGQMAWHLAWLVGVTAITAVAAVAGRPR
jgi:hypothetical protein